MFHYELSSVPSVSSINSDRPPEQLVHKQGVVHKPPEVKQPAFVKTTSTLAVHVTATSYSDESEEANKR